MAVAAGLTRGMTAFPRQFWLLVVGTLLYVVGYDISFPFETIYLHSRLGISMTTIGLILGLCLLAGLPMQILGGVIADRVGRRTVLIVGICASVILFEGLGFAGRLWQLVAVIAIEAAAGWAMFMTANNAMIADLNAPDQRAEAFSISRVAVLAGMAFGPLIGGLLLSLGLSYRQLFVAGGVVCALFLLIVAMWLNETKPAASSDRAAGCSPFAGYRVVLRDRRFLCLCAIALLPLYGFGQIYVTLPVLLRSVVGVSVTTWGLLASLYAFSGVVFQYPVMRKTKGKNKVVLMAMASALIGLGLGSAAIVPGGWLTAVPVLVASCGAMLLIPVSSTIIAEMAPLDLRGRYMAVWTLVWMAGLALGPLVGGLVMDRIGGRGAFGIIFLAGELGAVLFAATGRRWLAAAESPAAASMPGAQPDEEAIILGEMPRL